MADIPSKFGLQSGYKVCLLEAPAAADGLIRQSSPPEVQFYANLDQAPYDLIFFWPPRLDRLTGSFASLQKCILPDGAIWAMMPKKKFALKRGIDFTWEQMQAAGLQTDLVDNKTATLDEQDYGTRFVIRKLLRRS